MTSCSALPSGENPTSMDGVADDAHVLKFSEAAMAIAAKVNFMVCSWSEPAVAGRN